MPVTAWVLIQTGVGKARAVADAIAAIEYPGVQVLAADTVTGPHDVISHFRASDLDTFNQALDATILHMPDVEHTVTCMAFNPG